VVNLSVAQRIKQIRNELKLSQSAFGKTLGVSKDVIVNIELERVPVKELMLKLICKTFNVNPLWLEKGEGDMFLDIPDMFFDDMTEQFDLSISERRLVENFLKMSPTERRTLVELMQRLLDNGK
jgi:DNA-binding XRE family transcriptional regulator